MPLKVLVIDHNAAEATLVHHALGAEGYEVATATTLDEGLSILKDGGVDLLLIANDTPADAISTWWSEAKGTLGQVPIILLGEDNQLLPVVDSIATPIDTGLLVDAVRTHLEALAPDPANVWLPEALREESAEIAEMERLLGWGGGPATEDADPVSLGIFSHDEAQQPHGQLQDKAPAVPLAAPDDAVDAVDTLELPETPAHDPEPAGDALRAVDALRPIEGEAPDTRPRFAMMAPDDTPDAGTWDDPATAGAGAAPDSPRPVPRLDAETEAALAREIAGDLDAAFAAFTGGDAPREAEPAGDRAEAAPEAVAPHAPIPEAVAEAARHGEAALPTDEPNEMDEMAELMDSLRGFLEGELAEADLAAVRDAASVAPEATKPAAEPELVLGPAVNVYRDPLAAAGVRDGHVPLNAEAPVGPRREPTPPPVSRAVVHANELPRAIAGLPIEQVERIVAQVAREVVEQVVWETVPLMVARLLSEKQAHQDQMFAQIVERAVWESLPALAESRIQAEIHRLSGN
ncbi:MAG: hypothetical protein HZA24_09780 [Nitrospirae bacterium]|nr:hypothetical protein [Nitrospirota bacterium]